MVLRPAGGIGGMVIDSVTGTPVSGVRISVVPADAIAAPTSSYLQGVTGPDGRYHLPSVKPGVYVVKLHPEPDSARIALDQVGVRVEVGQDTKADFNLIPARKISGRVVSTVDGHPVAAVDIHCSDPSGYSNSFGLWSTESDPSGRFSINVPPGRYEVATLPRDRGVVREVTVSDDFDPESLVLEVEPQPIEVVPQSGSPRPSVEIVANALVTAQAIAIYGPRAYWGEPSGTRVIQGRILDTQGAPIAGVRVWPLAASVYYPTQTRDRLPIMHDGRASTTDRNGRFILKDQAEGDLALGVWRLPVGTRQKIVPSGVNEVEFTLPDSR